MPMDSRFTLTIATPLYPPDIGGPATYTKLLESELPKREVMVKVVSFGGSRHLPKGIRHIHYFFRLFQAAKGSDALLAQDPVSVGLPALLAARLRRITFIIRMPGDYAWEQAVQRFGVDDSIDEFQHKHYGVRVEWLRSLQKFVSKRAAHVITPSNYFKKLVAGWGISESKLVTIYNGVDFTEQPTFLEKPAVPTMVSAGRLVPWKGMEMLIEILPKLPDWELRILGDGPERAYLEAKANTLGVKTRVHFMGALPHKELLGWCKVADAFVLNTQFESFSFQVVEAMMCGVPVVTTTVGSLPELITSGQEGILIAPNDDKAFIEAIKSTVAEPELWNERTERAQEKAVEFSIDKTVDKVEQLLRSTKAV